MSYFFHNKSWTCGTTWHGQLTFQTCQFHTQKKTFSSLLGLLKIWRSSKVMIRTDDLSTSDHEFPFAGSQIFSCAFVEKMGFPLISCLLLMYLIVSFASITFHLILNMIGHYRCLNPKPNGSQSYAWTTLV
jgi:hypothetical protein